MPVSKKQSNSAFGTTANLSVTLSSPPVANNIIIALAGSNASLANQSMATTGLGGTAAWDIQTEAIAGTGTTNVIGIYARTVAAGDTSTYTLNTVNSTLNFLHVFEFQGVGTLAQSVTVYDSLSYGSGTTTAATPSVTPAAGVSGYALATIWLSGGTGGTASNWTASNGFTSPPTTFAPSTQVRAATAELSIASTTGSAYNTTFTWPTSRQPATAIVVVTEVNNNVYVYAVDTIYSYENVEIRRDPITIPTITDTVTVADQAWYYDELIIIGDKVVIVIGGSTSEFFAWFG